MYWPWSSPLSIWSQGLSASKRPRTKLWRRTVSLGPKFAVSSSVTAPRNQSIISWFKRTLSYLCCFSQLLLVPPVFKLTAYCSKLQKRGSIIAWHEMSLCPTSIPVLFSRLLSENFDPHSRLFSAMCLDRLLSGRFSFIKQRLVLVYNINV